MKQLAYACILVLAAGVASAGTDRIYGKITTVDGDSYQGIIRWDRNEVSWVDQLNGTIRMGEGEGTTFIITARKSSSGNTG